MPNTMVEKLRAIAAQNVNHHLNVAKRAEEKGDYKYANRVVREAKKWSQLVRPGGEE